VIRYSDLEPVPESIEPDGRLRLRAAPEACRLSYDGIGSFLVEGGSTILCDPTTSDISERKVFRRVIERELMAILLHQRGLLVLHASAVSVNGKAVVFVGQRGAGKSTTAAAFEARGHPVLDDDVVGIRFDRETPTVVPGLSQLRLSPDAVDALDVAEASRPTGDWGPPKRYRELAESPDPVPLAGVYILQTGDELAIKPIPERNRLFVLVTSSYARGLLSDLDLTAEHFRQCSEIVSEVPIRRLQRPQTHDVLPRLVDAVVDDIG